MPYVTEIPAGLISVADGNLSFNGPADLSDMIDRSADVGQYKIDADGASSLSSGDNFTFIAPDPSSNLECTYLGAGTLNFAPYAVNLNRLDLQVTVSPINGYLVETDGKYYFVTDGPLDNDHVTATIEGTVGPSQGNPQPVSVGPVPLSQLADSLANDIDGLAQGWADRLAADVRQLDDQFVGYGRASDSTLTHDQTVDRELTDAEVVCFVAGTLIETDRGPVPVEELVAGDTVWTKDDGFQPIRWIGSVKLSGAMLANKPNLRPIRIRAGALGANTPSSDLLVSPQHRVLVRSRIAVKMFDTMEVLIPAKQLLQIDGIDYDHATTEVEYFHFLFDRHQIVVSNGAETESLFTGPQALRALTAEARDEVLSLFPELAERDYQPEAIRPLPSGRKSRKLVQRHASKHRDLVC
ncbi:Hint domain-containing protein [Paracoccus sp. PAR01]|uniref:Hint domain-containing protein n=1 Tax=Paracoccus sp. PAR01 TaxID=2769282 RepID=UPI001CE06E35|nr:Hint domain-containing protein [Paracoccus sp. PAR01]